MNTELEKVAEEMAKMLNILYHLQNNSDGIANFNRSNKVKFWSEMEDFYCIDEILSDHLRLKEQSKQNVCIRGCDELAKYFKTECVQLKGDDSDKVYFLRNDKWTYLHKDWLPDFTEITLDQYKLSLKNKDMNEENAPYAKNPMQKIENLPEEQQSNYNHFVTKDGEIVATKPDYTLQSVQKWCDENGMVLLEKDEKTGVPIITNKKTVLARDFSIEQFEKRFVWFLNKDVYYGINGSRYFKHNVEALLKEKHLTISEAEKLLSEKLGDNYKIVE